jgi:hypothetical protein
MRCTAVQVIAPYFQQRLSVHQHAITPVIQHVKVSLHRCHPQCTWPTPLHLHLHGHPALQLTTPALLLHPWAYPALLLHDHPTLPSVLRVVPCIDSEFCPLHC